MLRVTPLYGSCGHHPNSESIALPPTSTLIEYGGVKVLVNVGWDESFSAATGSGGGDDGNGNASIPPRALPAADVVLITDSTLPALGGLPIYYGKSSRRQGQADVPPIYGTYPTVKMGQMTVYDLHATASLDGGDPGFTLGDVDGLFGSESFRTLKYSQTLTMTDRGRAHDPNDPESGKPALGITPHRAGHVVGGVFWVLRRLADETEVVVAPTYHHARERHLDSATLHKFGAAADVLITRPGGPGGPLGGLYSAGRVRRKAILTSPSVGRDEGEFVETVMAALRRGGNVLCPVDASGRVLELLLVLSSHWDRHRLGSACELTYRTV